MSNKLARKGFKGARMHTPLPLQMAILMMDRPRYCCQGRLMCIKKAKP